MRRSVSLGSCGRFGEAVAVRPVVGVPVAVLCLATAAWVLWPTAAVAQGTGPMSASSAAFEEGGDIPQKYTCEGDNISPPLLVEGVPEEAQSVALIMDDPDVPSGLLPLRTFTHWILWDADITPDGVVVLPEDGVPSGAVEGRHDGSGEGYTGPCPPIPGDPHTYTFTFFAVDTVLGLEAGASRSELEAALEGHVLETAVLTAEYARSLPLPLP